MECSTCAYATPVTDRFLSVGKREPTLAHCEFRKYMVLWHGKCEERNVFTMKYKYKRKKA